MIESKLKKVNSIWFDEIPENWSFVKLKYMIEFLNGFAFKSDDFEDDGTSIVRIGDINSQIDVENCKKVDLKKYPNISSAKINKGDILIAMTGATIGKNAQYLQNEEIYANQRVGIIRSNDDFSQNYLRYVINTFELSEYIRLLCSGSAQENISGSQISDFIIPVPPLSEQTKIAAFLDQKTAQIDTIIEKKQKLLQLLDEKKKSVINEAVTGQKVWNGNAWVAPIEVKDSGVKWIGEIPQNWQVTKLGYHSNITTGKTPKIESSDFDYFEEGTVDWFTPSDFTGGPLQTSKRQIHKKSIIDKQVEIYPKGAIYLVGIGATLGKVSYCEKEASANQQINIILLNPETCHYKFAFYYLFGMNEYINSCSDKATLPILNQGKTRDLIFLLPPLKIQMEIVNVLDNYVAKSDFLLTKINFQLDKLKEYRQSLISEAVTGKLKI